MNINSLVVVHVILHDI